MSVYLATIKQTLNGNARATRREFWVFLLQAWCVMMLIVALDNLAGGSGWLPRIYLLAMLPVLISVTVRRLHDTGRSAGWLLLWFIPVLGWLYLFLMMVEPGDTYPNDYT